jgi:hypothetical protein
MLRVSMATGNGSGNGADGWTTSGDPAVSSGIRFGRSGRLRGGGWRITKLLRHFIRVLTIPFCSIFD